VQIVVTYESDVANAPAGFKACVNAVCQYLDALLTSPITVHIGVGYGTVDGQAMDSGALGESSGNFVSASYSQVAAALKAQGTAGSSTLPSTSPASGTLVLSTAEAKALGLRSNATFDGYVGFSTSAPFFYDPTQSQPVPFSDYDFFGTVEHEITETLGRVSFLNQSDTYSLLDLFRYASSGARQLTTGSPSWFSIDGGATRPLAFNNFQTGDQGDLGDWATANRTADSFNDDSFNGTLNPIGATDKSVLSAIGFAETAASQALTVSGAVPSLSAAAAVADSANGADSYVRVVDSGTGVSAQLDQLESLVKSQTLAGITLTGSPITLSIAQMTSDAGVLQAIAGGNYGMQVQDSGANVAADLSELSAQISAGTVSAVFLTDGAFYDFSLSPGQFAGYTGLFNAMGGNFYVTIDATGSSNLTLHGLPGHATVLSLSGAASQYTLTPAGDGVSFSFSSSAGTDHFDHIVALDFGTSQDFVATMPAGNGGVTSGNVTELYGAVFGREPDVPGLGYYETVVRNNPSLPLTTYAQWFIASPEYVNNPAHAYAQTSAGDAQFITDSYQNLLHRAPETGAVAFYQTMINQITAGTTPGTAAFTAAWTYAHAVVLTDFSQSAEFLGDVQITAQHPADSQHWLYLI